MKHKLLLAWALTGALAVAALVPVTDNFNRGNELLSASANWVVTDGAFDVFGNSLYASAGVTSNVAYHTGCNGSGTQTSQIVSVAGSYYTGLGVRILSAAGGSGYFVLINHQGTPADIHLYERTAGTFTQLVNTTTVTVSNPSTIKLEHTGTVLNFYADGVLASTTPTTAHLTGSCGVYAFPGGLMDDWKATTSAARVWAVLGAAADRSSAWAATNGNGPSMAEPLAFITIAPLLDTQQSAGRLALADAYSPDGNQNIWIDKRGRIRAIEGYTQLNATALVSSLTAAPLAVRAIFMIRVGGATVTRRLVAVLHDGNDELEVWTSGNSGSTWTRVASYLLTAGTAPTAIPDAQQFGDLLYLTVPGATMGWTKHVDYLGVYAAALPASTMAAPTVVPHTTGGTLSGQYRWILVPRRTDGTRKAGSAVSAAVTMETGSVTLTWVADADVTVVGYEVYRTTGTGNRYYLAIYSDGRTVIDIIDGVADAVLITARALEEHGEPIPQTALFLETHKQRLWVGGRYEFPLIWFYSDPGLPESFNTAENFINFSDPDVLGDIATGGTGNFRDLFVAWFERSIWTVSGTGTIIGSLTDWTRRKSDAGIGTVSHRTVARVPMGAKYTASDGTVRVTADVVLAYLTPLKDIRVFDGVGDEIISAPMTDSLQLLDYTQRAKAYVTHDSERQLLSWVIPDGTGVEPRRAIVWNYRYGTWHEWVPWNLGHAIETETPTDGKVLVAGEAVPAAGGRFYTLWDGGTFNGTAFPTAVMTKALYPPDAEGVPDFSRQKRFRWVEGLFEHDSAAADTMTVEIHDHLHTAADAADIAGTFVAEARPRFLAQDSAGRYFHGLGVRIRFATTGAAPSWILNSIKVAYQTLRGLQKG